jgi:hypothetical protein
MTTTIKADTKAEEVGWSLLPKELHQKGREKWTERRRWLSMRGLEESEG